MITDSQMGYAHIKELALELEASGIPELQAAAIVMFTLVGAMQDGRTLLLADHTLMFSKSELERTRHQSRIFN